MPSDAFFKVANRIHRTVFDLTRGHVGGKTAGLPVVKLTTTGRKSGRQRDTMLLSPVHDDRRVVLVASKGGAAEHPLWYLNLRDDPGVVLTMRGRRRPMSAHTATAEEKAELWPAIVKAYKGYGGYQEKTDRDIPVVILESTD
ncbi:MAG: nitroreductase family deazaflavin-dependent oxidoreductase [bacterium]